MKDNVKNSSLHRRFLAHNGLFWFATALPLSMFVRHFLARGLNLLEAGIVLGASSVTVVLSEVPTGMLADRVGRVKTYALAAFAAAGALVLFMIADSFLGFVVGMASFGFGRALASGSLEAWYVDEVHRLEPGADIQTRLAKAGMVGSVSIAAGTLVGGALAAGVRAAALPLAPVAGVIALSASFHLLNGLWALGLSSRDRHSEDSTRPGFREIIGLGVTTVKERPVLLPLFVAGGATFLGLYSIETFWQPLFMIFLGESNDLAFGGLMAGAFVAGALGNLAAPRISRLFGGDHTRTAVLAFLLTSVALVGTGLAPGLFSAAAGFLLAYLALGLNEAGHQTLLNRAIPSRVRATMLSFASLTSYLGAIGGVGLAWAADRCGPRVAWIAGGLVVGVSSLLYRVARSRKDPA